MLHASKESNMNIRDHQGMAVSGACVAAVESYREALHAYHCYAGDPMTLLGSALQNSPGFVMGHVLTAHLTLIGTNAEVQTLGVQAYEAMRNLPCNEREQAHVTAVGHIIGGELRAAGRVLEDLSMAYPMDSLALQAGHIVDFLRGDSRMLRDRIGRALPRWSADMPDYHAVQGMLAFGLEESGQYERAEAAGLNALHLEPRNGWAKHAVAHVLEMQDRREQGIRFMRSDMEAWTEESFFQVHNWWHLALFHLGLDQVEEVLSLYDGPIYGARSDMPIDMIDAAALLWRLHLRGVDLGDRWKVLADLYVANPQGLYAFDDAHAMMAFVGSGRLDAARALLAAQTVALSNGGDNAGFVSEVGLPVMQALLDFGEGRYATAADGLRRVRNQAARFGGSHAQRDLLDLTLIEAASRSRDTALEQALRAERAVALGTANAARARLAA
jgi:tetratricopeptide (TPR) repeat protein